MNHNKERRKFLKTIIVGTLGTLFITTNVQAKSFVSVDTLVSKLVAIGIPGLIVLAIAATSGLTGGAATIMALSTLGGPLGILGGVAAVAILALAVDALAGESFEYIGSKAMKTKDGWALSI